MKKVITLFVIIISMTVLFSACKSSDDSDVEESASPVETYEDEYDGYTNPLTGEPMDEDISGNRPFAVMFNNTQIALPQHGTSEVDIFYEMLAEGGVTRILGVYQDISDVGDIGTIRSVRSYFLDCVQGLDAILIHAGGSDMAYEDIETRGVDHIDGVKGTGDIFFRDSERIASIGSEHSMFTSSELIEKNISNYSFGTEHDSDYSYEMKFADDGTPQNGSSASGVEVVFSDYKTGLFEYDADKGVYYVSEYSEAYIDGNNDEQVSVTNVLVLYSGFTPVTGTTLLQTNLVGSGSGYYACGGEYVPITWSKDSYTDQFVYTLEDGTEVVFGCGKSYINIVPTDTEVNFK